LGRVVEFIDQGTILFDRSVHDKQVHAADKGGGDHFAPFGFAAGLARGCVAEAGQVVLAIALFEGAL